MITINIKLLSTHIALCFIITSPILGTKEEQTFLKESVVNILKADIQYHEKKKSENRRYSITTIEGIQPIIDCLNKQKNFVSTQEIDDCSKHLKNIVLPTEIRTEAYRDIQENLETLKQQLTQEQTMQHTINM